MNKDQREKLIERAENIDGFLLSMYELLHSQDTGFNRLLLKGVSAIQSENIIMRANILSQTESKGDYQEGLEEGIKIGESQGMLDGWVYADEINEKLSFDEAEVYLLKILDRQNGANFYKGYVEQSLAKDFICDLVKSLQANNMPTPPQTSEA